MLLQLGKGSTSRWVPQSLHLFSLFILGHLPNFGKVKSMIEQKSSCFTGLGDSNWSTDLQTFWGNI